MVEGMAEPSTSIDRATGAMCASCRGCLTKSLRCSACKKVKYCGVECQKADWRTHKPLCKKAACGLGDEAATSAAGAEETAAEVEIAISEEIAGEEARMLGELLEDQPLAAALAGAVSTAELRGVRQLAEQSVKMGIDYASLGLGWHHPQSRLQYRQARHDSTTCPASRARAGKSRAAIVALARSLADADAGCAHRGALLPAAFAAEISASAAAAAGATGPGVLAALEAELLLPLRALNEDRLAGGTIARTFNGDTLPADKMIAKVDEITARVLDGTFSAWRYANPVGARQLEGLSAEQRALWREAGRTEVGDDFVVHEDGPGELGFFWATKIGGPSHGFDYEGQCLLPLLANARHKVVLVTDPRWPHHPAGRAHLRLLWTADDNPPRPVLWLEAINTDFDAAHLDTRAWTGAVLAHLARKAEAMGALLSVSSYLGSGLLAIGLDAESVRDASDRLTLRPSNAVVEASDYLGDHDWLQLEEETTRPLRRVVYDPVQ